MSRARLKIQNRGWRKLAPLSTQRVVGRKNNQGSEREIFMFCVLFFPQVKKRGCTLYKQSFTESKGSLALLFCLYPVKTSPLVCSILCLLSHEAQHYSESLRACPESCQAEHVHLTEEAWWAARAGSYMEDVAETQRPATSCSRDEARIDKDNAWTLIKPRDSRL